LDKSTLSSEGGLYTPRHDRSGKNVDKYLRKLGFQLAHARDAQTHKIILQMLDTWAGLPVQKYAELIVDR